MKFEALIEKVDEKGGWSYPGRCSNRADDSL